MNRRKFIVLGSAAALTWPATARPGQQAPPVIGLLHLRRWSPTDSFLTVFRGDLKKRGLEEGRDLRLLIVQAAGGNDRFAAAARELVAANPDVVVVFGDPATRAVQRATNSIPIVAMTDDMVGSGLVASLARPGGNTTGLSILASELDVKRLELLHTAVPRVARIGILADSTTVAMRPQLEQAARRLGVELVIASFASSGEAVRAADRLAAAGIGAINILATPLIGPAVLPTIIAWLDRTRLPAIGQWPQWAQAGMFLGYGPDLAACFRRVSALADKVLKGAKPADLPIEQPTNFELVINMKTAKALGLTVPPLLLAQADEVIQ
jgi:putative ABC transport system substrate-binding protein